jgi:hypothetical protein
MVMTPSQVAWFKDCSALYILHTMWLNNLVNFDQMQTTFYHNCAAHKFVMHVRKG